MKHPVYDTDRHFTIDLTNFALVSPMKKISLVKGLHNAERFTFDFPRTIEGHDLSLCDSVEVHFLNIDAASKEKTSPGTYKVNDIEVYHQDGEEKVIFSWLIDGRATQYDGVLNFAIHFKCTRDGKLIYKLPTAVFSGISISDGVDHSEAEMEDYQDVVTAWMHDIEQSIDDKAREAIDKVVAETVGGAVDKAIEDALEGSVLASDNLSNALKGNASGTEIIINDLSPLASKVNVSVGGEQSTPNSVKVQTASVDDPDTIVETVVTVSGATVEVTPIFPAMIIKTDSADVHLSAEYNKDTNVVIAELREAIEEGGGGTDIEIVHELGDSEDAVMSQKAVTEAVEKAKSVVNITSIDTIYESVEELPATSSNGTTYVVANSSEKATYAFDASSNTWNKKYDLKAHTVYCALSGAKAGLYRFTMSPPYLLSAESHTLQEAKDYADSLLGTEVINDLYDTEIPVGEIIDGKMIGKTGGVSTDAASCATDFIPVISGHTLRITNCFIRYSRSICAYDENKSFVECVATESTYTEVTYTVPKGVTYIRVTGNSGVSPRITKINHPVDVDIARVETVSEEARKDSKTALEATNKIGFTSLYVGELTDGYIDPNTGKVAASSSSSVTDFIEVIQGARVEIKGAYLTSDRNISGYDGNKNFVVCIIKGVRDTEYTIESVPYNVKYIRITCPLNTSPIVHQITTPTKSDIFVENITYDINEFENGYISDKNNGVNIVDSTTWCHSPYISVHPHQEIELTYYAALAGVAFYCYDENKNLVLAVSPLGSDGTVITKTDKFLLPYDAHYIRVNGKIPNLANLRINYTKNIPHNMYAVDYVKDFFNKTHRRTKDVFQTAKQKPILTIIDDDTCSLAQVSRFHDFCMALGIRGTFACLTSYLDNDKTGELKNTLLEYEREGFHITLHSHTQNKLYETIVEKMWVGESWSAEEWNEVERDFVTGLQKLQEFGFIDYKFWVTPYGVRGGVFDDLARKWGLHCAVGCGGSNYETDNPIRGRYCVNRPSIGGTDASGSQTLEGIKAIIDDASQNNGWLLVATHMWDEGWVGNLDRFRELVDYAKSKGMEVKTLNEAWRIREPIYRLYETF